MIGEGWGAVLGGGGVGRGCDWGWGWGYRDGTKICEDFSTETRI